jgi:hypothetical protein
MEANNETINETKVTKTRMKSLWTKNDVIIAFLYAKYGLRKVGVQDDEASLEYFVNEYIGSNYYSLTMEANNIKNVLNDKHNDILDNPYDHTSKTQEAVVYEYDSYSEDDLAQVVNDILDNVTEEQREENLSNIDPDIFKNRMIAKAAKAQQKVEDKRQRDIEKMLKENKCIVVTVKSDKKYYIAGDNLIHKTLGEGLITNISGKSVTINFTSSDAGVKTIFFNEEYFDLV